MSSQERLQYLKSQIAANKKKGFEPDIRDWKPTITKEGKGWAVIRFLDKYQFSDNPEVAPWVEVFSHSFKGPTGAYYNENCLSTIGDFNDDPVNRIMAPYWKGTEAQKRIAQERKRKRNYWSNVYVVKDPANTENEGKVFRYRYGQKIWQKIEAAMNPEFEHEESRNPFDIENGMNFTIAIRRVEGFPNYDKCAFDLNTSPLVEGRKAQEAILAKCHDLRQLLAPENFKSAEELERKYWRVVGEAPSGSPSGSTRSKSKSVEEDIDTSAMDDAEDVSLDEVLNS